MSPIVLQLPLDLTGEAATNLVAAEQRTIGAPGSSRAIVPTRGPFYTRRLVVRNKTTGVELIPDTDYRPVHMFLAASQRACQEICSVLLFLPTCQATEVEFDYQAIGGDYSSSVSMIEQMLASLDLDNRTVLWGDIIGAPEYFPPTAHLHDIGDVYGFEYVVVALEQIRRAILLGDQAAFDEQRQYIDLRDNELRALIQSAQNGLGEHINNTSNPHQTTKGQVGLGAVENYPVATQVQAEAGTSNVVYMTALTTKQAIAAQVGGAFNAHVANTNNPHQVTKGQVGLGSVVNYPLASTAQAQAGSGDAYMTATLSGAAIAALALTPLNAHINNTNNPHNTNKGHVGLGNVDNFLTATTAQAQAGTATNLFMTPATSKALIDAAVGTQFTAHINNTSNPHQVTKAQVGLGSVEDYKQVRNSSGNQIYLAWLNGEIRATVDATSMGRVHTTSQPDPNIAAHANRTDNPHGTTAGQVGLGNVQNYGIASQGDAEAGSSNSVYMTPIRTAQLVQARAVNPLQAQIDQRVVIGSNASLNTLAIGNSGYLYQDGDGSITLRVAGSRYFQFQAGGNYVVHNGRAIAGAGFQPSDKRFKKKISSIEARALWREVDFKQWTHKELDEHQRGVIAQDLQKAAPDRVTTYRHGIKRKVDRLAVDYTGSAFEMAYAAGCEADAANARADVAEERTRVLEIQLAAVLARLEALEAKA
ncbi:hypothetical protein LUCX_307 [Xanthomonas phage vB_XciM_LucasX]|nr:hypothetical protein LUCX_307 [Xanthomonas phage vB_XciM_LucasX]